MCHSPVAQFQLSTHRSPTAACVDKEHVSQAVVSLVQHRIVSSYYHFGFVGDVGDVGDVEEIDVVEKRQFFYQAKFV